MPLIMTRRRKQNVPPTSQIGAVQSAILEWLLTQEEEIEASGTEHDKLVLAARGVSWNVKQFCKSFDRAYKADGKPNSSKISTSLKQLEVKRGLVKCHGTRTSHVRLTETGRKQAPAKREDPRTWQEKRAVERARRRATAISYELHRYGNQMTETERYINLARQAYYLTLLQCMGQDRPYEERWLASVESELRGPDFRRHLPVILQDPSLTQEEVEEIMELHKDFLERDVYIYAD